jgi:predicted amidophosphoribosyltransferase
MCHYLLSRCTLCHTTLTTRPENCGHGLAVLGPDGLTVECDEQIAEVVEESELCSDCKEEEERKGRVRTRWEEWVAWRRGGGA